MANSISKLSETMKIDGNTAIHDFPEKYNSLITNLNQKIMDLNAIIIEKDAQIAQLQNDIARGLAKLKAEFLDTQDQLNNN